MADSIYFFILMHSVIAFIVTGREYFFINQIQKRYQTFYTSNKARSFVHCVYMCSLENQCCAVNYNAATSICELIDVEDLNKQDALTVGDTWTATKKGIYLSIYRNIFTFFVLLNIDKNILYE